jgi:hypothetical protein
VAGIYRANRGKMMKCIESIPQFSSRVELSTFLRTIADDVENGKARLEIEVFSIHHIHSTRSISITMDILEEIK